MYCLLEHISGECDWSSFNACLCFNMSKSYVPVFNTYHCSLEKYFHTTDLLKEYACVIRNIISNLIWIIYDRFALLIFMEHTVLVECKNGAVIIKHPCHSLKYYSLQFFPCLRFPTLSLTYVSACFVHLNMYCNSKSRDSSNHYHGICLVNHAICLVCQSSGWYLLISVPWVWACLGHFA